MEPEKGQSINPLSEAENLLGRINAFWYARERLIQQLKTDGVLEPTIIELPQKYMLALLEQFGLRGVLENSTENFINELLRRTSEDFKSARVF